MSLHRHQLNFAFLLLLSLSSVNVLSTQEGASYFFYQQPEYPRDCKEAGDQCSSDNFSGVYTIKPDGYPQPFEAYCNNDILSGGWTVIQRQLDGSVAFARNWEDYKNGFGFLSSEFWIGNDKLSYLTNQAMYELRIDMMMSNGSSFYVKYKSFRISDELSQYTLVNAGEFMGNLSCVVSTCPSDMNHGGCTCQRICNDPVGMTDCNNDCVESCLPDGCVVGNSLISNGDSYINDDCTQNCSCINNQISCDPSYQCSPDATCTVESGVRKCYCNEGFIGDGEVCVRISGSDFTDCYDAYQDGHRTDGIYTILPTGWPGLPFDVFCNMTEAGGGWTVFQRRIDGITDFYRGWEEYKNGFGIKDKDNDFWLGNEKLYYITNQKDYIVGIDIVVSSDVAYYGEYTSFRIGNESVKYQMSYGSWRSSDIDPLYYSNGAQFSTPDQDNDECTYHNCAEGHRGAWWYKPGSFGGCVECYYSSPFCYDFQTRSDCHNICSVSNFNGDYNGGNGENIYYAYYYYCNLKYVQMKIRPSST
ncbi:Ryncolin-4 [Holothuria leucospilota]|uniref:Ryncolin-4 n=1 Tax=Holothuria leucospilota TaxID=206669 RepID=A0A9Q1H5Y0_HOLLE|nr:Ryncolin-4 [Holothuria leucospilota]